MRVTIKLFAILRERAGLSELTIDLPNGATVADARDAMRMRVPALESLLDRVAFAVNRTYAQITTQLNDGDEVAAIPPVSGG